MVCNGSLAARVAQSYFTLKSPAPAHRPRSPTFFGIGLGPRMEGHLTEFVGLARGSFDTYVLVRRVDGATTTLPKRVYIDADYRPSYDRLPVLPTGLEVRNNA